MSDWEDNPGDISVRVAKQNKWDDEDADEEDVKDNWDESSDEETTIISATPSKKTTAAQRAIAKKEKMNNNDNGEDELDEFERKKREHKAIIDADLENTKGLFGIEDTEVDKVNSKDLKNAVSPPQNVTTKGGSSLDKINPKSKEEFDEFSKLLVDRIQKHEKQTMYGNFISGFVRELCLPLKDVDVRKVATTLTNLANERQKPKDKPKKKGKSKPTLQVENFDSVDITNYDEYDDYRYDDYDDFI